MICIWGKTQSMMPELCQAHHLHHRLLHCLLLHCHDLLLPAHCCSLLIKGADIQSPLLQHCCEYRSKENRLGPTLKPMRQLCRKEPCQLLD